MGDVRCIDMMPNPFQVSMNDDRFKSMKIGDPRRDLHELFVRKYQLHSRNPR